MSNESLLQGIDIKFFADVYEWIGANQLDLEDPVRFAKIKDIIAYIKDKPDPKHIIIKAINSKNTDKVQHLWEYVQVRQKAEQLMSEYEKMEEMEGGISEKFEDTQSEEDAFELSRVREMKGNLYKDLEYAQEEIRIYEK
jgi:hypothetical protein